MHTVTTKPATGSSSTLNSPQHDVLSLQAQKGGFLNDDIK